MALVPQDIIVMYKRQLYLVSLLPPYMYRISLAVQKILNKETKKMKKHHNDHKLNRNTPPKN